MNLAPSPAAPAAMDDVDVTALSVPTFVKVAAGACMATGAFTLGLGAQTGLMLAMRGAVPFVLAAMVLLGLTTLVSGFGGLQAKASSIIAGAVASGAIALCGAIWAVFALSNGLVSPLSFFVVVLAIASAVLAGVAIGPARKVSLARAALREKGLDFGV